MLRRDDFLGHWQVDRQITDRHSGMTGAFAGAAVLAPSGADGADYAETGQMRYGAGAPMLASRRYIWQFLPDRVQVRFADGGAFHDFIPMGQAAGSDHLCGADDYRVIYDFTAWPHWRAIWQVSGPRKDYTSITDYRPAQG